MADPTHDPQRTSWVESANRPDADFPIQNLPFGVFVPAGGGERRIGVAIGDAILDLRSAVHGGVFRGAAWDALCADALNEFLALGQPAWRAVRRQLSDALQAGSSERARLESCLVDPARVRMVLPARIGDYTDFFTSIHHATRVGMIFRPDEPLLPNYKWLPIAYHGRSSSVVVSGAEVRRPRGQILPRGAAGPIFAPSQRLDYELELGAYIGPGNPRGSPIRLDQAEAHLFGLCLLNDWSARDIQAWEYQPLGPFLAKSFATTVSPWIVTMDALEPFRCSWIRPPGDPAPLAYLDDDAQHARGAYDIELEVHLRSTAMAAPARLSRSNFRDAYWTLAQMVAHHTVAGCNLQPGDLLGTGTQSGPQHEQSGSLLELSLGGRQAVVLPGGEQRRFLEDGDEVTLSAACARPGAVRIGFGRCVGKILPALDA